MLSYRPLRPVPLLLVAALLTWGGCRSRAAMNDLLDAGSIARLDALEEGSRVLLSLSGLGRPPELPALGAGGRLLGRSGNSALVEVPQEVLPSLAAIDGLGSAAVWGAGSAVAHIEPALRNQVLEAVDRGNLAVTMPMIAVLRENTPDVKQLLESRGAVVRTVAGQVATLDASPEAVFGLLALPELVSLSRPRELRTLGDR